MPPPRSDGGICHRIGDEVTQYLAAPCPKCSKWIPLRECEGDDPTFDPNLLMMLTCAHCGQQFKLSAAALEVVPESKLQSS
jgi:hypothetical protein